MIQQREFDDPSRCRLHNVIDMALQFSAMIRLFEKGSKTRFREAIIERIEHIFQAQSETGFRQMHQDFCAWGVDHIHLAERNSKGKITRQGMRASYGQIAKTLDVSLKVVVYYCQFPDFEKSQQLSKWLNAAVDTKMMAMLRRSYPQALNPWPKTVEQVDCTAYMTIQRTVRTYIQDKHQGTIIPVQFDDIYWRALNKVTRLRSTGWS